MVFIKFSKKSWTIVHGFHQFFEKKNMEYQSQTNQVLQVSDPIEIGGIFPPTKSLSWRIFLFPPSGAAATVTCSNQCK